ncbi:MULTISPECIES: Kiwa anti-phage protein KwaB-like domain-containing protein [Leuconostoc]|uniref:DUF4868 domain-containing protein n=1 Tax=Leuconostoc inhae TaxID=178001 RepID=A0AAN2QUN6_9LACO|nr:MULTISPECIES: Kiwa anti-phage protein KwaB-like domain-containing protein [Leuconostoc]MBZ5954897.1 DUF4868 domain-containing protein [Leuconostoc gasicomitatum]MBZ5957585.1 DUF4868 domain-containing protein [Leuconostoc gasicomitatum]MBZ5966882.1 DUF4868 domain-containing protein [Leuconostoc gasicomitatum]MBZ5981070.1 DUF4868 domain-containing protein [Leuconostoc gasicomitatum]MBZ5981791.1 DUF4868 domain-containing protein [Leuconostoc gasicomitatum]
MEEKEITSDTVLTDVKTVATMLKKAGADVRLYLLWKNKKETMFSYAETSKEIKDSFKKRWMNDYNDDKNQEITQFNVGMEKTDHLMFCSSEEFPLMKKHVEKTNTENDPKQFVEDLSTIRPKLNLVRGYCAHIYTDEENLYLFGSTNTFNSLTKSRGFGLIGNVGDKEITKLSDDDLIIGFNPKTTCYIHNSVCVIKNKKGFEDLFGLLEEYKKLAEETIKLFSNYPEFYQGIENFEDDLNRRPILYRSVVNFGKKTGIIESVSQHLDEIKMIKENDAFKAKYKDLKINDKGIVYTRSSLPLFLSLLNEEPVKSIITGNEFFAEH